MGQDVDLAEDQRYKLMKKSQIVKSIYLTH